MLGRVVVENGVKKIVPLTADCGSGNPCGAIITVYQRTVPNGYLPLGAQYDITQFPVLYSILGTDTIPTASALGLPTLAIGQYVIKATSGINENQADNVLSALSPVDVVALNNVHSVTSNAVARAIENKKTFSSTSFGTQLTVHRDSNGGSADIKYSNNGSVLGFMGIGPDAMPEFVDKNESIVKRIPYIDYANISGTTDNNGLLDLGSLGNYIPIMVYDSSPYITQFFNGSSGRFHPYVRLTNYDGTPLANTQVTLRLIVLPL